MKAERAVAWCLLLVWATWGFALQGWFASSALLARWWPDLGVVFLLLLDRRFERGQALLAVALVSTARAAFSADPPLAIFVGYGASVGLFRLLRSAVEVDQPLLRTLYAGLASLGLTAYWGAAREAVLAAGQGGAAQAVRAELPPAALSLAAGTALTTLCLGPLFLRLPGLSPLWRRRR